MSTATVEIRASVDTWRPEQRLGRFVLTGRSYGMAHATQKPGISKELAARIALDPEWALAQLHKIRSSGQHFNREAFFVVLAMIASHGPKDGAMTAEQQAEAVAVRRLALEALPELARTPEDLFCFVAACRGLRGWGPAFKASIYSWFVTRPPYALAKIVARTWLREYGWRTIDLLRLAHPRMVSNDPKDNERFAAISWLLDGKYEPAYYASKNLELLRAVDRARNGCRDDRELAVRVRDGRLTFDMLPQPVCYAPHAAVAASLEHMTASAVLREPRYVNAAVEANPEAADGLAMALRNGYVCPLSFMLAPRSPKTADIYDRAYDEAFPRPFDGLVMFAIECSPAMEGETASGLNAREAACAWAAMYARRSPEVKVIGFDAHGWYEMTPRFRDQPLEALVKLCAGMTTLGKADLDHPLRAAQREKFSRLIILGSDCTWSPAHEFAWGAWGVDRIASLALCGAKQPQPPDSPERLDISGVAGDTPELVRAHIDASPGFLR